MARACGARKMEGGSHWVRGPATPRPGGGGPTSMAQGHLGISGRGERRASGMVGGGAPWSAGARGSPRRAPGGCRPARAAGTPGPCPPSAGPTPSPSPRALLLVDEEGVSGVHKPWNNFYGTKPEGQTTLCLWFVHPAAESTKNGFPGPFLSEGPVTGVGRERDLWSGASSLYIGRIFQETGQTSLLIGRRRNRFAFLGVRNSRTPSGVPGR